MKRGAEMQELLRVTFPGLPPTVNQLYRTSASGLRYKQRGAKGWQKEVSALIREAWGGESPWTGDAALDIVFSVADRKKWDIDNRVKALQDCLQMAGVLKDDAQIRRLAVERVDLPSKTGETATELTLRGMERGKAAKK